MDNPDLGAGSAALVLGATGFIGSRLIPELRTTGARIRIRRPLTKRLFVSRFPRRRMGRALWGSDDH